MRSSMTAFSLPEDASPLIQRAYQYWQQIAPAPGRLPGRQHFDPLAIPSLLPHVWLVDVTDGTPPVFRYRLVGTAVDRAMGRTHTGQRMDAVMPDFYLKPAVCGPYIAMLTTPQPSYRKGLPLFAHNRLYHALERILLPMARDGITVDMLFCLTLFYMPDGTVIGSYP